MHLTLLILSLVLIFRQSCYGEAQSEEKSDTDSALSESVVPEDSPPVPQASAAMGESPNEAQSPVEEYLKEHPDVSSVPASINSKPKPKNPPMMPPYMGGFGGFQYPMPMQMPMHAMPMPGYPYPYGMPQMMPQMPPQQQMEFATKKRVSKTVPAIPDDVKTDFKQSESEDAKFAAIIQAAEQEKANKEYGKKGSYETVTELSMGMGADYMLQPPSKDSLMHPQMMPNPYMQPYHPYMPAYQYMQPNQFKIDKNNVQMYPMSGSSGGYDPNIMRKLQSGHARLDLANAKVVSVSTELPESKRTEATSMEEYPEIPEVVVKEQRKKAPKKKTPATLITDDEDIGIKEEESDDRDHSRKDGRPDEIEGMTVKPKKPTFILRAKLNNLPKKGQHGKNAWWNKPVPDYCSDAIIEVTECKHKKLQKRWSYNPGDERCYLYEDYCASVKRNTFKTIQDCVKTCWRPK